MDPKNFTAYDPGHNYWMENHEGDGRQEIHFIQKTLQEGGELKTEQDGVTTETVLGVLIDRMEYLDSKVSCEENKRVIEHLRKALDLLNLRTENRKNRGVEGTNNA